MGGRRCTCIGTTTNCEALQAYLSGRSLEEEIFHCMPQEAVLARLVLAVVRNIAMASSFELWCSLVFSVDCS
jgi:hypothetical protein